MDVIIDLKGFSPPWFFGKSTQNTNYLYKRQYQTPTLNSLDPDLILVVGREQVGVSGGLH